ncbi:MAG: hypothetical protein ACLFSU_03695 [Acholeplasmataceae bacterium]
MKKWFSLPVLILFALVLFACEDVTEDEEEPVIEGLPESASIVLSESIDVLEGVTATDYDGNDITSDIVVTVDPDSAVIEDGVVTPEDIGTYLITLTVSDDLDQEATASLFLEVKEDQTVEEVDRVTLSFDEVAEDAFNGFVAKEMGDEVDALTVEDGKLIYQPIEMGESDGDNQLYRDMELTAGTAYQIEIEARASREIDGVAFIVNDPREGWDPYDGTWDNALSTDYETLEISFTAEDDNDEAELLFNVGGQSDEELAIHVRSITVVSFIDPQSTTYPFTDLDQDGWSVVEDAGTMSYTVEDEAVTIDVAEFAGGIWEQRLEHESMTLEPEKVYELTYTIHSTESLNYEFLARTEYQVEEDIGFYVWSNPSLSADETRTVSHTFETTESDIEDFRMLFQFGNQSADSAEITISDIGMTYYDDLETTETRFTGLADGFDSFEEEPAEATLFIDTENGRLVYDVETFGDTDWHNKVFYDEALFEEGAKYRVEFEAYASEEIEGFFAINPVGQWNPKVSETFDLTTESATFSYETPNAQQFDQEIELLFQFGAFNTGSAEIYIESITIIELR